MTDNKNNSNEKKSNKWFKSLVNAKTKLPEPIKKMRLFIWRRLKESFCFAVLKACILIFILTYIVFAIKPSRAHIAANFSEIDSRPFHKTNIVASSVSLKSQDCERLLYMSYEPIRISLNNWKIEGIPYDSLDQEWLVIYPDDNSSNLCEFEITGQIREVALDNTSGAGLKEYWIGRSKCSFTGPQCLHIYYGRGVLETRTGATVAELDGDTINLKETPKEAKPSTTDENDLSSLAPYWGPKVIDDTDIYEITIESCHYPIDYYDYQRGIGRENQFIKLLLLYNEGKVHFEKIQQLESTVVGKLVVSYTPTPQEYDLYKQEIKLVNETKSQDELELVCNVGGDADDGSYKTEGVLYGYITGGEISGMSLFPSFETWFYSNAYMTPTAIIAIVLSATALFTKKNSEAKGSDKNVIHDDEKPSNV